MVHSETSESRSFLHVPPTVGQGVVEVGTQTSRRTSTRSQGPLPSDCRGEVYPSVRDRVPPDPRLDEGTGGAELCPSTK